MFLAFLEAVMEMRDGSDVPRMTRHGACQEAVCIMNEVGDNRFHEVLRDGGERPVGASGPPLQNHYLTLAFMARYQIWLTGRSFAIAALMQHDD